MFSSPSRVSRGRSPRYLSRFNHFNSWRWQFSAWHLANLHNKYDDYHDSTPSNTDYHCYSNSPGSEWFPPNKFANWRAPPPPDSEWFPPNIWPIGVPPAPTPLDTPLPRHLEALWAWGPGAEAMSVVRSADRSPGSFRDLAISNLEDGGSLNDIQHA